MKNKVKFTFSYKKQIILKHFSEFASKYCDVGQEGSPSGTAKDRPCQTQFDVLLSEWRLADPEMNAFLNKTQKSSNILKNTIAERTYFLKTKNYMDIFKTPSYKQLIKLYQKNF